jgi:maltooligosyltrehalose trehalohydrolase
VSIPWHVRCNFAGVVGVKRRLPIGAELADRGVHFRVWAPAWKHVTLVLESPAQREVTLEPEAGGYHAAYVAGVTAGARYRYRLGTELYADPASRYQPDGPFGPSRIVDPNDSHWTDASWQGIPEPAKQVVYEMHVGTFTPEGTWAAAAKHLPFLRDVGITTIEMMPINEFAGHHGWGYDGVQWFAPFHHYGTPADLRAFVDRAHALGVAVILDVVYNHFGPAGNWHFVYAPQMKRTDIPGEWGDVLDFRVAGMREHAIVNARYWIEEYHFDGLRIDATQAIVDDGSPHIITEIVKAARVAARTKRIWIVGENEPQDTALVASIEEGGNGLDALWNDDFEHSTRVALTGVNEGYFHDYRGTPREIVAALEHGFLYQGQLYAWQRNTRGTPTKGVPPSRFVHFLENHDQVANTGFGDRVITLTDPASYRAMTAVLLLGPQIPMLFQGQEVGSAKCWQFFCDHNEELNKLVRKGRADFVKQFPRLATAEAQAALLDPSAKNTFERCILDPDARDLDSACVKLHRDLIELRRETRAITDGEVRGAQLGESAFCLRYWHADGDRLLLVNLGRTYREAVLPEPLLAPPLKQGWRAVWSSEHPDYGGHGTVQPFSIERLQIPAHSAVLCVPDPSASLRIEPPPDSGEKVPLPL